MSQNMETEIRNKGEVVSIKKNVKENTYEIVIVCETYHYNEKMHMGTVTLTQEE